MNRTNTALQIKAKLTALTLVFSSLAFQGCVPEEKALPEVRLSAKADRTFPGFQGLESAQTLSGSRVRLSWSASPDPKIMTYNVYDVSIPFTPKLLKAVPAPLSSTTITGLTSQTLYRFRVRATTETGLEDTNRVDLPAIPYDGATGSTVLSSTSAKVNFSSASNSDEIRIFCGTSSSSLALVKVITDVKQTDTTLTGLTPGQSYTCKAAVMIEDVLDNNQILITFIPIGVATRLVFSTQPSSVAVGSPFPTQPVIRILDANDNLVSVGPDSTALISMTLAPSSPTSGTLRGLGSTGIVSVSAVGGIATFSTLNFQEVGEKILRASKPDTTGQPFGSVAMTADSSSFTLSPAEISALGSSITVSPTGTLPANGSSAFTVSIRLADQYGNPIPGVKPVFGSSNSADTLVQPVLNTDSNGTTTGSISSVASGISTLRITSPSGLTAVSTTAEFTAGAASKVVFVVNPSTSKAGLDNISDIQVHIQDSQGNRVTTSTANVTVAINVSPTPGAVLSGTLTVPAVAGIASFTDLGIDKTGIGYKLVATATGMTPSLSNSFNITAGDVSKIVITGPTQFLSTLTGCSNLAPIRIQLQDAAGNAANAPFNTQVTLSGLGSGSLFSSTSCGGSPIGSTITFTTGSNFRDYYYRNPKANSTILSASAPTLTTGTKQFDVNAYLIGLSAPAAVLAGQCSNALVISTAGADGTPGPRYQDTTISIGGLTGSLATLHSDSSCATEALNPSNILFPAGSSTLQIYLKDPRAETLSNLTAIDLPGAMFPNSNPQQLTVKASKLELTGPSYLVSGNCSTAFTATLKDSVVPANSVLAAADTLVQINGLSANSKAYVSCASMVPITSIVIPEGQAFASFFIRDEVAETLPITVSDGSGAGIATSTVRSLTITPSKLLINGPASGNSIDCIGPFTVSTNDGATPPNLSPVAAPVTINLTGAQSGGAFYSDAACTVPVSQFIFAIGDSSKNFYYKSFSAGARIFTGTDPAGIVSTAEFSFSLLGTPAWIGSSDTALSWFQTGQKPVRPRNDFFYRPRGLHIDSTRTYMYVGDADNARVLKFNLQTEQYIGWIGAYAGTHGVEFGNSMTGSVISSAMNLACLTTPGNTLTPGWCQGGTPNTGVNEILAGLGWLSGVWGITSGSDTNGNHLYVAASHDYGVIQRFNADTGAYEGWIGRFESTSGSTTGSTSGVGNPVTCSTAALGQVTPGWCIGGRVGWNNTNPKLAGYLHQPREIAFVQGAPRPDGGYYHGMLYVASYTQVSRYNAVTGEFLGWIGRINNTNPTAPGIAMSSPISTADAPIASNTCSGATTNQQTPGWCLGGQSVAVGPTSAPVGGMNHPVSVYPDVQNGILYVMHLDNNMTIMRYNLSTGALITPNSEVGSTVLSGGHGEVSMTGDGSTLFVTDMINNNWARVVKLDASTGSPLGQLVGWLGRVGSTVPSFPSACSSLTVGGYTPVWCIGGTTSRGIDETSFLDNRIHGITYDGNGKLYVGISQDGNTGAIRRYDSNTGAYLGTFTAISSSSKWSATPIAASTGGFDDNSYSGLGGIHHDGTHLYAADVNNARIKRIDPTTGSVLGWIGAIMNTPTSGGAACLASTGLGPSPGWCLGAWPSTASYNTFGTSFVSLNTDGIMSRPYDIASDSTYIYVTDDQFHRISRFRKDNGLSGGWIGRISTTPTGGDTGCTSLVANSTTSSLNSGAGGWCRGGSSTSGSGNGMLSGPGGLYVANNYIYVVDRNNNRVVRFGTDGGFQGWIGRSTTQPSSCSFFNPSAGNFFSNGWCLDGTPAANSDGFSDPNGGFHRMGDATISGDANYLYIGNPGRAAIDRYTLAGQFEATLRVRTDVTPLSTWVTNLSSFRLPITAISQNGVTWNWNTDRVWTKSLWVDGTSNIYGLVNWPNDNPHAVVFRRNLSTGILTGMRGAVGGTRPTGGDSAACLAADVVTGSATPTWCTGWNNDNWRMRRLGTFFDARRLTGDSNFIYVTDSEQGQITRLPK